MKLNIRQIDRQLIKNIFFVRQGTDEDHVLFIADLYQNGVKVTPIDVNLTLDGDYAVVDGRHRLTAQDMLHGKNEKFTVECNVLKYTRDVDMMFAGFSANLNSSKPPTKLDVIGFITTMLEKKVPRARMMERLAKLWPKRLCDKFIKQADGNMQKRNLYAAKELLSQHPEMSVATAAAQAGVKVETLMSSITRRKKNVPSMVASAKGVLTQKTASYNMTVGQNMRAAFKFYQDGVYSKADVKEVIRHIKKLAMRVEKVASDWDARGDSMDFKISMDEPEQPTVQ